MGPWCKLGSMAEWCCEMDDQLDVLNERERDFVDDMAWKLRINDPIKKQLETRIVAAR